MMLPDAALTLPRTTSPLRDEGIVRPISNNSGPSATLSLVTGTSIVVLVVPAVKVAVIGVEV